jgi:large subunit ribosomal protein L15e
MALFKYLRQAWQAGNDESKRLLKERLVAWRQEPVTLRLAHPTRLDRARSLGFKAKLGYIVVRQRVIGGGHVRGRNRKARRSKHRTNSVALSMSYQEIAERRANDAFPNCEVLGSYFAAKDGNYHWFEVVMADKAHPSILADKRVSWVAHPANRSKVFRGLTSPGKESRGLRHKGKGAEKMRPSNRANGRRAN